MEIEFKLQIPPGRDTAIEQALSALGARPLRLQARYFDTPDGRLRGAGIVLRLRREGAHWMQTLKTAGASTLARQEHEVDRGPDGPDAPQEPDTALHAGSPAGEALDQALGPGGAGALVEIFGTDIERLRVRQAHAGGLVELALDRGEVFAVREGRRHAEAVRELELELVDGPVDALAALAADWCRAHGLWLGTVSKSQRGLRQAGLAWQARRPGPPRLDRHMAGAAIQRALVDHCLALALPAADTIAGGDEDPVPVHALRTALRRLRTVLRELGGLAQPFDSGWEPALAGAFRALGRWQDHVQLERQTFTALAELGGPPLRLPPAAGPSPAATVRGSALQVALIGLLAFAASDAPVAADRPPKPRSLVRRRLGRLHDRLLAAGRDFETLEPAEQHQVRKRLKRLRYLAELTGGLFKDGATQALQKALKPAQDALGRGNDRAVALEALRGLARDQPAAWFGVGVLTVQGQRDADAAAKALKKLARTRLP